MKKYLKFILPSSVLFLIGIFIIRITLFRDNIIHIPFEKYSSIVQVEDDQIIKTLWDDIIRSSILEEEKMELVKELLISKYPNSNTALKARMWISWIDIERSLVNPEPLYVLNQARYMKYKECLKYHPNSVSLLFELAANGYDIYPHESAVFADKAIAMDSLNADLYLVSSKAYQMLGKYSTALERLERCRGILIDRILSELSKDSPYKNEEGQQNQTTITGDRIKQSDVEFAKSYLIGMGYKIDNIVNSDVDGIGPNHQKSENSHNETLSQVEVPDPDDPTDLVLTPIEDLKNLQRVNYFIKRIREKNPVWYPNRKKSPVKELKSLLKTDR